MISIQIRSNSFLIRFTEVNETTEALKHNQKFDDSHQKILRRWFLSCSTSLEFSLNSQRLGKKPRLLSTLHPTFKSIFFIGG